jgi:hypothetical protein
MQISKRIARFVLTFSAVSASGQTLLESPGGTPYLHPTDLATLEAGIPRNDLNCAVTTLKPKLGLDFVFHAGFDVSVPTKDMELSVLGNDLAVVFRITSQNSPQQPIYMSQRLHIPARRNEPGKSVVEMEGSFVVGEGKYHVDWLLRDKTDHICFSSWDMEAKLGSKEASIKPRIAPGSIQAVDADPFREEIAAARELDPANVDIIVNFGPRDSASAALDPGDVRAIMAILRQIAREPRIGAHSLLACSTPVSQVLYQQETSAGVDFPSIGESLKSLKLGLVSAKDLAVKNSRASFIGNVIKKVSSNPDSEALILIGPKMGQEPGGPREIAGALKELNKPVFYMSYDSDPISNPWRDLIGSAVKQAHGNEYGITTPRDLCDAWSDIVSRIARSKRGKGANATGF